MRILVSMIALFMLVTLTGCNEKAEFARVIERKIEQRFNGDFDVEKIEITDYSTRSNFGRETVLVEFTWVGRITQANKIDCLSISENSFCLPSFGNVTYLKPGRYSDKATMELVKYNSGWR